MKNYLISSYWMAIPITTTIVSLFYFAKYNFNVKYYNTNKKFNSILVLIVSFAFLIFMAFVCSLMYKNN